MATENLTINQIKNTAVTIIDTDNFANQTALNVTNQVSWALIKSALNVNTALPNVAYLNAANNIFDNFITAPRFVSTTPIGTPPLTVTSTTVVPNLNADQVDGYNFNQSLLIADNVVFASVDATSLKYNGADINTAGAVPNIAYLDQNNTFAGQNIFNAVNQFAAKQRFDEQIYIGTDTPIGTAGNLLDVGGSTQVHASVYPLVAFTADDNSIQSLQLQNKSAGVNAEMRFIAARNDNSYVAFTAPSSFNTGDFFGIPKKDGFFVFSVDGDLVVGCHGDNDLVFGTSNTERARILKTTGYFGIGKTPTAPLDVQGTFKANNVISSSLTGTRLIYANASSQLTSVTDFSTWFQSTGGSVTATAGANGKVNLEITTEPIDSKWNEDASYLTPKNTKSVNLAAGESYFINSADINTSGTLSNMPYLGIANSFIGNQTAPVFISNVAIGTAPLQVTSTTKVPLLNVDQVDGFDMNQSVQTTDSPLFVSVKVGDTNTYVNKDGLNNLVFTDAITGTKTLAEIAYLNAANVFAKINTFGDDVKLGLNKIIAGNNTNTNYTLMEFDNADTPSAILTANLLSIANVTSTRGLRFYVSGPDKNAAFHLESLDGNSEHYITTREPNASKTGLVFGYLQNGDVSSGTRHYWRAFYRGTDDAYVIDSNAGSATTSRFSINFSNGVLSAETANYANLVTSDEHLTNKKYVDNTISTAVKWNEDATYITPKNARSVNVGVGQSYFIGANTHIDKDAINNLTFTDVVTGTKTLAELAATAEASKWDDGIIHITPKHSKSVNVVAGQKYYINSVDINTSATLSNVAYLDTANVYSADQSITKAGTASCFNLYKNGSQEWKSGLGGSVYEIKDVTNSKTPFYIVPNAPDASLAITALGQIGFGTGAFEAGDGIKFVGTQKRWSFIDEYGDDKRFRFEIMQTGIPGTTFTNRPAVRFAISNIDGAPTELLPGYAFINSIGDLTFGLTDAGDRIFRANSFEGINAYYNGGFKVGLNGSSAHVVNHHNTVNHMSYWISTSLVANSALRQYRTVTATADHATVDNTCLLQTTSYTKTFVPNADIDTKIPRYIGMMTAVDASHGYNVAMSFLWLTDVVSNPMITSSGVVFRSEANKDVGTSVNIYCSAATGTYWIKNKNADPGGATVTVSCDIKFTP